MVQESITYAITVSGTSTEVGQNSQQTTLIINKILTQSKIPVLYVITFPFRA